jgi:hypothetical protein
VLHPFTRGAHRFPKSLPRLISHAFGIVSIALLLALCIPAHAQTQDQDQPSAPQAASSSSSSQTTQQNRESRRNYESRRQLTRQRREAQAVTDTYSHRWDVYLGGQYMRFRPGPNIHNSGVSGWTLGATRYFTPRFGITADARGLYGTNSLGATGGDYHTYNASFSVFPFTIGPQYRFYGSPKWSISGAVQGGAVYGYFDANTNGFPPQLVGFYPAGIVAGGIASLNIDYNLSSGLAVRVAPHILFDHFGGLDHNQGVLVGIVYRFGRQ